MSAMKIEGCSALITGASSGIGREFARQLGSIAGSLVLIARRRELLEKLRHELTKRDPSLTVHLRQTDLSQQDQVEELCEWIEREKISIDLLINNAGLGDVGPFATSNLSRVKEMMLVNMVALTLLTRRLLPPMVARKRGAILNVSSSAGFLPMAGFAIYAATKAYVTSFSEALRTELRGTGVIVSTLCPGPVHTEFKQVARRPSQPFETAGAEFTHVSVEGVVRTALEAVERDRSPVIPGFVMKLAMLLTRLTPMPLLRLATRLFAKRR